MSYHDVCGSLSLRESALSYHVRTELRSELCSTQLSLPSGQPAIPMPSFILLSLCVLVITVGLLGAEQELGWGSACTLLSFVGTQQMVVAGYQPCLMGPSTGSLLHGSGQRSAVLCPAQDVHTRTWSLRRWHTEWRMKLEGVGAQVANTTLIEPEKCRFLGAKWC